MEIGRIIVTAIAAAAVTYGLYQLQGCNRNYGVYGGLGQSFSRGQDWDRPNTVYGRVGAEMNAQIHKEHDVWMRFHVEHDSDPTLKDRPGDNRAGVLWYKRFE